MGIKQSKTKRLPWVCPICGYVNFPTQKNLKKKHEISSNQNEDNQ